MSTEQIAVRLSSTLLSELDELVESGAFASRAAAVRAGVEAIAELEHRRRVDRSIVEGYRRNPPTSADDDAARASLERSILEEPW